MLALSANFFCLSRWYYSTTIVVQIDQFGGGAARSQQQFKAINREMWVQKIDLNIPYYTYMQKILPSHLFLFTFVGFPPSYPTFVNSILSSFLSSKNIDCLDHVFL